jgi:hypothetical protein
MADGGAVVADNDELADGSECFATTDAFRVMRSRTMVTDSCTLNSYGGFSWWSRNDAKPPCAD